MARFGGKPREKIRMKSVGEERRSKLTQTSGCGAFVEFPGFSGIMGGQNLWPKNPPERLKIHDKRLLDFFKKDYFLQPECLDDGWREVGFSVPVVRFPEWFFCTKCHELDHMSRLAKNLSKDKESVETLKCNNCGQDLIPSRFVMVCEEGHVDEFPYKWWCHKGKECSNPKLRLTYTGKTGGLDSILISCDSCGAKATMANCLNKGAVSMLKCHGRQPWLGRNVRCECGKEVRIILRGASNAYYPQSRSALTIPPWSSKAQKIIEQNHTKIAAYFIEGMPEIAAELGCKNIFDNDHLQEILGCGFEAFLEQVKLRFGRHTTDENVKDQDIFKDEYKALSGPDIDDYYLKTVNSEIAPSLKPYFSMVKQVRRLREIQVLYGFRRISAFGDEENLGYTPLSDKYEKWLPATEMFGEGIFISFSKEQLLDWKKRIGDRYEKMRKRYNANKLAVRYGAFSEEYVCLHTFSHLLMKELSFECGYDSAAIKEKLYVSATEDSWMAGVLIYTATTCSDGSLGGLVRQGEQKRFERTVYSMINRAKWCSNDPICIESEMQGNNALNYAACHVCTLVSETSCSCNNILLDRFAIVGDLNQREKGYLAGVDHITSN